MAVNFSRFIIEKVVDRGLQEMRKNSKRELRNLVELGMFHAKGRFQNEFFGIAQKMLADQKSPYYDLAFGVAGGVETAALKKFGINLGYNAWTVGARRIREVEARTGCNVPWTIVFDLNEEAASPLTSDEMKNIVSQARELGICSFMFLCDQRHDFDAWMSGLMSDFQDCVFFLFVNPADIRPEICAAFRKAGNGIPIVAYVQDEEALYQSAAELLRKQRCLYGSFLCYGENDPEPVLQHYTALTASAMPPVTFLLCNAICPEETMEKIQTFVEGMRLQPVYPTFFIDFYKDIAHVDSIISTDPSYLGIASDGGVYIEPGESPLASIRADGLVALLQRLLPKPALA